MAGFYVEAKGLAHSQRLYGRCLVGSERVYEWSAPSKDDLVLVCLNHRCKDQKPLRKSGLLFEEQRKAMIDAGADIIESLWGRAYRNQSCVECSSSSVAKPYPGDQVTRRESLEL